MLPEAKVIITMVSHYGKFEGWIDTIQGIIEEGERLQNGRGESIYNYTPIKFDPEDWEPIEWERDHSQTTEDLYHHAIEIITRDSQARYCFDSQSEIELLAGSKNYLYRKLALGAQDLLERFGESLPE